MSMSDCVGQARVAAQLKSQIAKGRVSHAYLFAGHQGTGKQEMAEAFAKALNCLNPVDNDSCDTCLHCRQIEHGNSPHYISLAPNGETLKIAQVRELQTTLSRRLTEAGYQVYVVEAAEKMTAQAANRLLKTIEEPEKPSVAILLTEHAEQVLPTLLSRCQKVNFFPLPPEAIERQLLQEGGVPGRVRVAAHLARGLEEARYICQTEGFAELVSQVVEWLQEALTQPVQATVTLSHILKKYGDHPLLEDHAHVLIQLTGLWLRDLLRIQEKVESGLVFFEELKALKSQAASCPREQIVGALEQLFKAERRMAQHVNVQLALEDWVFTASGSIPVISDSATVL